MCDGVIDGLIDHLSLIIDYSSILSPPCAETEKRNPFQQIQRERDKTSSLCLSSPARFSSPLNRDVRGGRRRPVAGVLPVDTVGSLVAAERRRGGRAAGVDGRSFTTRPF